MKNMNLNPGGIIGAVLCGGVLAILTFVVFFDKGDKDNAGRSAAKITVVGVVIGAVVGNFLWGLVFPPNVDVTNEASDDRRD